ncbi:hypothetical protein [Pseudomonas donghuensis]|uniref:hypothetical protein n=1 Tax=Pseudomonas donghuensis TaxID=1163398 RepID=UPI002160AFE8|nr:hypothetical protein [Pseudomonas donghuensis]UVL30239.1 hypothetical protein LOY32_03775 [Pseudomonas donghuensis]
MMKTNPTNTGIYAFHVLRQIGLSAGSMRKLDRYRHRQEKLGATVMVLSWPDGTWCVLAFYAGPLAVGIVALDDYHKRGLYEDACMMIRDNYLPMLTLRHAAYH